MPESYSKTEVDLKFEKLIIELKSEIRESRNVLEAKLGFLQWLTGGTFFLVLGIIITAALKILAH